MQKKKKNKAPLRRARHWGSAMGCMALKLLPIVLAIVLMGLMFSALQAVTGDALRIVLSVCILSGMLLILVSEGAARGLADAGASRNFVRLQKEGRSLTAADDAACYHPLKAVCASLCVFGIPLLLAAVLSVGAQSYTYALQDLPDWVTENYGARSDVMAPLAAYTQQTALAAKDVIRVVVRLFELVFVNLFADPQKQVFLIDRLSPLFIALYPLCYTAGYLTGPGAYEKQSAMQKKAKKLAAKKAQRKNLTRELLGETPQVHYGHAKQTEEHKRKELV